MQADKRGIKSISVAGRILKVMVDRAQPIALSELAELSQINSSQAHTYLTSFRRAGLVEQESDLGRYRIGPAAMQLAVGHLRSSNLQQAALAASAELSAELGMMVTLVAWGPQGPTVIQIRDGGSNLNLNMRVGTVFSALGTASGRMFAAFGTSQSIKDLIDHEVARLAERSAPGEQINRVQFEATLENIRDAGLAWAGGAPIPNVNAVCVPIFGEGGGLEFSMSIIEFADLMPVGEEGHIVQRLRAVAAQVSALGNGAQNDEVHNAQS